MRPLLADESALLRHTEQQMMRCAEAFGYEEIRLPLVERTELFARSIGEATDIVGKEMYSFAGRDGESLSLRPEGTAGCARAVVEQKLTVRRPVRLWYLGPMFRYERPQKGRSRQFFQFGTEAVGMAGVEIEFELLQLCASSWRRLGICDRLELQISSLGNEDSRQRYKSALVAFLESCREDLDERSKELIATNPLRILDSKVQKTIQLLADAPNLHDYLDDASRNRFDEIRTMLSDAGIAHSVNPRLVRGLDYYCHTVFEWVAKDGLGAQSTVCGGGRYDGLLSLLGGEETPAAGFAVGLDRLMLLLEPIKSRLIAEHLRFFIVVPGGMVRAGHLTLAGQLRELCPGASVETCLTGASLRAQMKHAHARGADYVVLAGEAEQSEKVIRVRRMADGTEQLFPVANLRALVDWTKEKDI